MTLAGNETHQHLESDAASRRVLFLIRVLDSGGVTTHLMTLAKGLIGRGWRVALASHGRVGEHSHGPEWFEANGIPHFPVPFPGPQLCPQNFFNAVTALDALNSAIREFRPSVLHVHFRATSPYALAASVVHRIPFVSTLHLDGIPARGMFRLGSFWGARAIAISGETRTHLHRDFRVPEQLIRTVYNGADDTYFRPPSTEERLHARRTLGLLEDARVVSLIGRLESIKGHAVLLQAVRDLRCHGMDVMAVLAGEGAERRSISECAAEYGIADRILFTGYVDTRTVLWASDVLVLPSWKEGFPVVIVEAMLCGIVPIRTPAAGAADQITDGVNGYLVPFGDSQTLASRLRSLLEDPALRRRMSAAALATARGAFTSRRMVDDTIGVYEEALNAAGSGVS